MNALYGYLLRVISVAMLGALVKVLSPHNGAGRVVRMATGLLLILCVVSPVARLNAEQITSFFAQTQVIGEHARTGIEIPSSDLAAEIISKKVRSYVLDKATELGAQIEVEVNMHVGGVYPYPSAIRITGSMSTIQRQELQQYIETTFAIPADRQVYDQ
ncbi:MAG: hypothetical protein E7449_00225 [Ruminococcaceae bacterium]|nr:hypothetical protein [Oscillospiraceae bacterium]